ncbi:MAG: polymerase ECF-type sigma factor [Chloroflexi bacterium]|nr:polymerase ECF-type sigma factor [Chloroflexota bacterium]
MGGGALIQKAIYTFLQPVSGNCVYCFRMLRTLELPLNTLPKSESLPDSEAQWLVQAKQGDSQGFSKLVDAYQRPVYNLCYRMLGNAEDAEDAAQETFLRAYKALRRYDDNRPFATWLLSIAAHYCIDQLRRKNPAVKSIDEMIVPDIPDPAPDMDSRLSRKQEQQRMRALLETLDPTDRAAVVMYYWYDYSYDEICQELGLTLSAVKSRLHRARKAMAERWNEMQTMPVTIEGRQI